MRVKAKVPFFFKQWGGVRKSEAGRELDKRTYDDMPSRISNAAPARADRLAMIVQVESWKPTSTILELTMPATPTEHVAVS